MSDPTDASTRRHALRLVSRRTILRTSGVGAVGAVLTSGAERDVIPFRASRASAQGRWDEVADIVVVGSGAAGLTAAVIAAELGNRVIVLEKGTALGGTTAKSSRGYWIPDNPYQRALGLHDSRDDAIDYMVRCSFPQLYRSSDQHLGLPAREYGLLGAFYDNASSAIEMLESLGALQSLVAVDWTGRPYPDYFAQLQGDRPILGRCLFTKNAAGQPATGAEMIRQMRAAIETWSVPLLSGHRVARLVLNGQQQIVGVEANASAAAGTASGPTHGVRATPEEDDGADVAIRAEKAVIFASGGYTHDAELVLNYQHGPIFGGYAVPTNEGDFIRIGGAIGAKFGNMKSAFRAQVVLEQALVDASVQNDVFVIPGDSFIIVNNVGTRVVNEKANYDSRTEAHLNWDAGRGEWTNLVLFLVYDQRQADYFAGVYPFPAKGGDASYVVSGQNWDELTMALEQRLASIADRIGGFQLDATFGANLTETVDRFNEFAMTGNDRDFQRGGAIYDTTWGTVPPVTENLPNGEQWPSLDQPNVAMYPLRREGPYYAILLGAGTLDTNGGPIINELAQILDYDNQPIPGLYGAGNCVASPCGDAYWGGGIALGVAVTFGYIAAQNADKEATKRV